MTRTARAGAALAAIAAIAGLATAVAPVAAVAAALVFLGLCVGLVATVRPLSRVVVVTSFFSRFRLRGALPLLVEQGAALIALPAAMRERSFRRAVALPPVILFALFIGWSAVISLVRAPDPNESFRIVGWLALDLVVLVVLLVAQYAGENPLATGVTTAGWVAALGIVVWMVSLSGLSDFGTQFDTLTGSRSLYATAFEANIFGSLLAMWLFVVFSGQRFSVRVARFKWLPVLLMIGALLLSLSRATILGLLVGLVVWQVLLPAGAARRRIVGRFVVIGLLVLAIVVVVPAFEPIRTRLGRLTDLSSSTGAQRVDNWKVAIDDLSVESVLFGLGTNSFGQRHLEPSMPSHPTPGYLGNLPLQVLYDSGVVGVFLLAGVFVSALPRSRRSRARSLGLFTVFIVSSLATSTLWFATTWIFLARGAYLRHQLRSADAISDADVATPVVSGE